MSGLKTDTQQVKETVETLRELLSECEGLYNEKIPESAVDKGSTHDELQELCQSVKTTCAYLGELINNTILFLGKASDMFDTSDTESAAAITADVVGMRENKADGIGESGKSGDSKGQKRVTYLAKDNGVVNVLGSNVKWTKYTDYKSYDYSMDEEKRYYDTEVNGSIVGTYYEYEGLNDNTVGSLSLNKLYSDFDSAFDPAKGDAYISGGYGYYPVSATIGWDKDVFGGDSKMTASVHTGIGFDSAFGLKDGKFKLEADVAVGLGVGVNLEIDYKNLWNSVVDSFKNPVGGFFPW